MTGLSTSATVSCRTVSGLITEACRVRSADRGLDAATSGVEGRLTSNRVAPVDRVASATGSPELAESPIAGRPARWIAAAAVSSPRPKGWKVASSSAPPPPRPSPTRRPHRRPVQRSAPTAPDDRGQAPADPGAPVLHRQAQPRRCRAPADRREHPERPDQLVAQLHPGDSSDASAFNLDIRKAQPYLKIRPQDAAELNRDFGAVLAGRRGQARGRRRPPAQMTDLANFATTQHELADRGDQRLRDRRPDRPGDRPAAGGPAAPSLLGADHKGNKGKVQITHNRSPA